MSKKSKETEIHLGDKVRDTITGFVGIAVGKTTWLHGCNRITVQPIGMMKDGKTYESQSFDEPQLEVVKPKRAKEGKHDTGGPRPDVFPKIAPKKF